MEQEVILSVKDLNVKFSLRGQVLHAIRGISLDIYKGESLAIVGESGSGKSVFTKNFIGLLDKNGWVDSGEIWYNGMDLAKFKTEKEWTKIRGKEVAMVMQDPMTSLNPVFTIERQVSEPFIIHQGMSKEEARKKVVEMLADVKIPNPEVVAKQYPHQLSGGMRQRVMIAMAMVCKPKLLIADEPTTALDVTIEAQILRLMKELRDETDMSVLIITHNMGVVAEICDYVYVMYAGKIMEQAETFELFDHTMHPYTKGLLDSIPRIGQNAERLHTIPGVVPNLLHLSQGCPFSNRCEYATDQCRTEKAQLHSVAPDHQVRCFRCEEEHQ